jgi:hypothetical protein
LWQKYVKTEQLTKIDIFVGFLLLKSKSVKLMKVTQEIAGQKDILRIFTNFYGALPKSVSGQQHPQILPHSN